MKRIPKIMSTESNKFPVESAPQKTYNHTFDSLFGFSWLAAEVFGEIFLGIILIFWEWSTGGRFVILFLMISLLVLGLLFRKRRKRGFITIAPEGLSFGGALNVKDGIKSVFSQEDFKKETHFGWEQIQHVGFTRDLMNPSFLFVELTDGETYYFPLFFYFQSVYVIIDNLRKFTGYSGCKDLGRYIPYVKRFKTKDASPHT